MSRKPCERPLVDALNYVRNECPGEVTEVVVVVANDYLGADNHSRFVWPGCRSVGSTRAGNKMRVSVTWSKDGSLETLTSERVTERAVE